MLLKLRNQFIVFKVQFLCFGADINKSFCDGPPSRDGYFYAINCISGYIFYTFNFIQKRLFVDHKRPKPLPCGDWKSVDYRINIPLRNDEAISVENASQSTGRHSYFIGRHGCVEPREAKYWLSLIHYFLTSIANTKAISGRYFEYGPGILLSRRLGSIVFFTCCEISQKAGGKGKPTANNCSENRPPKAQPIASLLRRGPLSNVIGCDGQNGRPQCSAEHQHRDIDYDVGWHALPHTVTLPLRLCFVEGVSS